jgi:hypothetical protein
MKMEQTDCFETSEYKIRTPENHPKERIEQSQRGESLNSRIIDLKVILIYIDFCFLLWYVCFLFCVFYVLYCFMYCFSVCI